MTSAPEGTLVSETACDELVPRPAVPTVAVLYATA
jgi:hypothetical protein